MREKLHYAGNVFIKEIELDEGEAYPSHKHKWAHMSHVAAGMVWVEVDGVGQHFRAPHTLLIKADREHKITAVGGPARWLCIHAIRDAAGDVLPDDAIDYTDRATLPTPLTYGEFETERRT